MNQPLERSRCNHRGKIQSQNGRSEKPLCNIRRATKWPGENGGAENVTIELDSIPIGTLDR